MVLSNNDKSEYKLESLIGTPEKFNPQKLGSLGSTMFFLESAEFASGGSIELDTGSKCSFQHYSKGLLLKSNKSNKLKAIPLPFKEIIQVKLTRGEENIDADMFSLFAILVNLGVSKLVARYFAWGRAWYSIDETLLEIETPEVLLRLSTSGYVFEGQQRFFERTLKSKLVVEIKPINWA